MKKIMKIVLTTIIVIIGIILLDTAQAVIFKNSPIIRIKSYESPSEFDFMYKKHYGILVSTFYYRDGKVEVISNFQDRLA